MADLTDIQALDFGYITGPDLLKYTSQQILIKQHSIDTSLIQNAVLTAYNDITGRLSTKYDIATELTKTGTNRQYIIVQLICLAAMRVLCANLPAVSEYQKSQFEWLDNTLLEIRNGQFSVPGMKEPDTIILSKSSLTATKYNTLG
jgi:phage gp36-like protein